MFGWFKTKEPERLEMDKHTKRYLFESFGHSTEGVDFGEILGYINQADCYDDLAYLSSAINSNFTGEQKQYLKTKMWDKRYRGNK